MGLLLKNSKLFNVFVFIAVSLILVISLVGFRDIKKEGAQYSLKARVVNIETPPPDKKVLVVQKTPVTKARKNTYVLVTDDTEFIGFDKKNMQFNDFTIGMCIEIQGLKIIEKEDGQEIIVVHALSIRPVLE